MQFSGALKALPPACLQHVFGQWRHKKKYIWMMAMVLLPAMLAFPVENRAAGERILTDQLGRQIKLPRQPQRVVALAPSITEIIFSLGEEQRLKGVTQFSNYPAAATQLPNVGSYVHLNLEKIVALRPDLCIAVKDGNPRGIADRLESMEIPVYAVDPRNVTTVMETITEIGRLLNADTKAARLVESMQTRIETVKTLVSDTKHQPRVFYQIGIAPIVSAGTRTFIHELITLAGGRNVTAGPVAYPRLSREQVLELSPEVFIITSMARQAVFEKVKREWSRWPALPAVRDQRIFLVDSDLFDRPTPRLVDGLEQLVRLIHPELF
jgi:iron complex transport system substrate-binding protein